MLLSLTLFILGFIILIKGADLLVDGASSIAKKAGVSSLVIGLTIVAFGTSAPELIVNIFASLDGRNDLAVANILGSNIANILLILGVSAVIYPLAVKRNTIWREIPFAILAVFILIVLANDSLLDHRTFSEVSRIDGIILISFFAIFIYYTFAVAKIGKEENIDIPLYPISRSVFYIILGMVGLALGGKWIVDGAVVIATTFGVSEALIGIIIVAVGTSLPELAASAVAAYKRRTDVAIGNAVGSNIFNIFWVLGLSSIINPLTYTPALNIDMWILVVVSFLLLFFAYTPELKRNILERIEKKGKHVIERWEGAVFVALYVAYIIFTLIRG